MSCPPRIVVVLLLLAGASDALVSRVAIPKSDGHCCCTAAADCASGNCVAGWCQRKGFEVRKLPMLEVFSPVMNGEKVEKIHEKVGSPVKGGSYMGPERHDELLSGAADHGMDKGPPFVAKQH